MNSSPPGQTSACAPTPLAIFAGPLFALPRSRAGAFAGLAALAAVGIDQARATPGAWGTNASGNWSTTTNWASNTVATGQNDLADFSAVNITADRTITLDSGRDIGDLKFGDATTPNFNWTLSGSNTLTLRNQGSGGGGTASIEVVNQTATISLVLNTSGSNATMVQKLGAGTLVLSGANIYTLPTVVSAGTLLANNTTGSATSTGAVNVASGATFGGSGTIAPTGTNGISVSGVLAPGAAVGSIGTLTFDMNGTSGAAAMASGASFAFELGLGGSDITSVGSSDLLFLSGATTGDFTFNLNTINFQGSGTNGFYKLFDTSSNNANTWVGLTFDGTTGVISSGLSVSNLASGKTGTLLVGTASNGGNLGDIYLSVVPEPSAALLAGLGSCLLFRRRRIPS